MKTLTDALIELVLSGDVDRDVAAAAAPNHHDFVIALERALKELAAAGETQPTDEDPLYADEAPPALRLA
jgi:ribosomal protein S12 methylthiotransferase accessory factor YcaO